MTVEWLSVDFETRSDIDLTKTGVYRYVESPHTAVTRMGYAFDFEPVQLWRKGEPPPARVLDHVKQGGKIRAFNAQFERIMWNGVLALKEGWPKLPLEQCHCTQAQALNMGLPASLDKAAEALGLNIRVDPGKRRRMMKFCKPQLVNTDGSIIWYADPTDAKLFDQDCMVDVEIERKLSVRVKPLSDAERAVYLLDQKVNDRGIGLDLELIRAAQAMVQIVAKNLDGDIRKLTEGFVQNTRKRTELLNWLWLHSDLEDSIDTIDKHALAALLRREDLSQAARVILTIRQESAKSSTAKLTTMLRAVGRDGRIRGTLQYYGARQTGRFAGRLMQTQNFPRGHIKPHELEEIVSDVKHKGVEFVDVIHGPPLDVVSSLLRGCIVAGPGSELMVADFNAIEARVLAWIADERPLLHAFRTNVDPYRIMAAAIYGIDVSKVTALMRNLGKMVVLAAGYQLGGKTLRTRLALFGIEVERAFADHIIEVYRDTNPAIKDYWYLIQGACMDAIRHPGTIFSNRCVKVLCKDAVLYIKLPSGRKLAYLRPTIATQIVRDEDTGETWEREQIYYWGVDPVRYQWAQLYTYGGKLTENIVQAIARDLLVEAMLRTERANFPTVFHVHDEIVAETPIGLFDLSQFIDLICATEKHHAEIPIKAVGWTGLRYRKD